MEGDMSYEQLVDKLRHDRKLSPEEKKKLEETAAALKPILAEIKKFKKVKERQETKIKRAKERMEARLRVLQEPRNAASLELAKLAKKQKELQKQCPHIYAVESKFGYVEYRYCANCDDVGIKHLPHEQNCNCIHCSGRDQEPY